MLLRLIICNIFTLKYKFEFICIAFKREFIFCDYVGLGCQHNSRQLPLEGLSHRVSLVPQDVTRAYR